MTLPVIPERERLKAVRTVAKMMAREGGLPEQAQIRAARAATVSLIEGETVLSAIATAAAFVADWQMAIRAIGDAAREQAKEVGP